MVRRGEARHGKAGVVW